MNVDPPVPPGDPPAGYRRVARPAKDWRVLAAGVKHCHWTGGVGHKHCKQPAVAELNRKVHSRNRLGWSPLPSDRWWAYCEVHTHGYSRWVLGDQVLEWHLVPVEGEETA